MRSALLSSSIEEYAMLRWNTAYNSRGFRIVRSCRLSAYAHGLVHQAGSLVSLFPGIRDRHEYAEPVRMAQRRRYQIPWRVPELELLEPVMTPYLFRAFY